MFKKNTAIVGFMVGLINASDNSDITTGIPVGYYTLDGGTQTAIADTSPVHEGNGLWSFNITADEMNGDVVALTFTHASAITAHLTIKTSVLTTDDTLAANILSISGDIIAADNLESQYDGTGYTDETAPASRSQVDNIGAASGGSLPFAMTEDNTGGAIDPSSAVFVGSVQGATTFADIEAEDDGRIHDIDDVGNDIDITYGTNVGGSRTAIACKLVANVAGNADEMKLKVYNHVGADWEIIATIPGSGGGAYVTREPILLPKHTGTGAELGKVYLRLETDSTTPSNLSNDQLVVFAVNIGQSVGYANGEIWVDTNAGNIGTEPFVDGTADKPVSTWAAALAISVATGLIDFHIINGSSIELEGNSDNYSIRGQGYNLALGGQSIASAYIFGATTSGIGTGGGAVFEDCPIGNVSLEPSIMRRCFFFGTITNTGTGDWFINDPRSRVAGNGSPVFDFGAVIGNTNLNIRGNSGGWQLEAMGDTGTDMASIEGWGQVIEGTCTGGTVVIRGNFTTSGITNLTLSDDARFDSVQLVDDVWDEVLNKTMHNVAQSGGKLLRQLAATVVRQDTAQGAGTGTNQIQLDAGASATDGAYDPSIVSIVDGTGAGQSRNILQYNGTTKTATVDRNWKENPDNTSEYLIISDAGREHVNEGLALGGTSTSIILNALASSADDAYVGQTIFIRSGTGEDQAGLCDSYDGTTKVATIAEVWSTIPDTTSAYVMLPTSLHDDAKIDSVKLDTGTTIPAQIGALNDPTAAAVAAAVAAYDMGNGRTIEEALAFLRNRWTIEAGILTVYSTDDTTILWTSTISTTAGDPVNESNPG